MSVYLVQHITNNSTTANQILSFYFTLQNKYYSKCINCWVDSNKNSVFFLLKALNKKTIKKLYHSSLNITPYKVTLVNNNLAYALINSQRKNTNTINHKNENITVIIKKQNNLIPEFNNDIYSIIKNRIICYNAQVLVEEKKYMLLDFPSLKNAENFLNSIYFQINEEDLIKKNHLITVIVKKAKNDCKSLLKLIPFIHDNKPIYLSQKQEKFLQLLFITLEKSYDNTDLNLTQLCKMMMMSKTKLYRNCKAYTGKSLNELLKNFRLNKALKKIKENNNSISQISIETGFSSNSYFSNCFKKKFGVSPSTLLKTNGIMLKN
ncbi:hypothetical protein WH52_12410 [Tenacibaculum holothuriorum]|uniref:HTH araC/xylS-type domain-containing protein n=1 Tax=Tenacibaculum holothuriorum TaxID=1635173 RepID=A0A1Y2PBU8_9FLAO|nr:helix-turn-helix transcriptional regulator [Tenacibaculum holothuriorum]OSY87257.1 hypothetical protein WH52_12410 [Tenacibaculum holothuriorum]